MSFPIGFQDVFQGRDPLQLSETSSMHHGQEGRSADPPQRYIQGVVGMDVGKGRPTQNARDRFFAVPLRGRLPQSIFGDPAPFSVAIPHKKKLVRCILKASESVAH
jgi:hypothetical protein